MTTIAAQVHVIEFTSFDHCQQAGPLTYRQCSNQVELPAYKVLKKS